MYFAYGFGVGALISLLAAVRGWRFPGAVRPGRVGSPLPLARSGSRSPVDPDPPSPALPSHARHPAEAETSARRVFVPLPPATVTQLYRDHMSIHADKLAAAYIGKWMRLPGKLDNVRDWHSGNKIVSLLHGSTGDDAEVVLIFADGHDVERLSVAARGDDIRFVGCVEYIDRTTVVLRDCELEND